MGLIFLKFMESFHPTALFYLLNSVTSSYASIPSDWFCHGRFARSIVAPCLPFSFFSRAPVFSTQFTCRLNVLTHPSRPPPPFGAFLLYVRKFFCFPGFPHLLRIPCLPPALLFYGRLRFLYICLESSILPYVVFFVPPQKCLSLIGLCSPVTDRMGIEFGFSITFSELLSRCNQHGTAAHEHLFLYVTHRGCCFRSYSTSQTSLFGRVLR